MLVVDVILIVIAVVLLITLLTLLAFLVRSRSLSGRIGSFQCAVLESSVLRAGIAHYGADALSWYKMFSLSPRPAHSWNRRAFVVLNRSEFHSSDPKMGRLVSVECTVAGQPLTLVMTPESSAGLSSWCEARPPGRDYAGY